jgi:AcrR family transcriptional regulator
MSPKSLTFQDKKQQKEKLLAKGRELLLTYGIRKTSVEDITKAANMAKGSFYQHFESKDVFFFELIELFHKELFQMADEAFSKPSDMPFKERVREFIRFCFQSPVQLFFFKFDEELGELLRGIQNISKDRVEALMEMEHTEYELLLKQFNIDTQKVKPGVVHNYLHAIYFGIAYVNLMEQDCMEETLDALINGVIVYIFGGDI